MSLLVPEWGRMGMSRALLHDLNGTDCRILTGRQKLQQELALRVGLYAGNLANQRVILSGFLLQVEPTDYWFSIAEDVKNALFVRNHVHALRPALDEMQGDLVL